jgi:hypothetical protein
MGETYKVEVKDPPQGMAPPHPGGSGSKKTGSDRGANRLRKFVAKPSAGLRIRIHPTLQSEQVLDKSLANRICNFNENQTDNC